MGTYSNTFPLAKLNRWRKDTEGGTGSWKADSKASQGAYSRRGPYVGEITFSAPEGFDPVVYKATNVSMTVTRDSSVGKHGDTIDLYLYAGYIDPNGFYDNSEAYSDRKISTQTIAKPASGTTTFTFSQTDLDRFNQYCLDEKSYRFMMWSGEAGFLSSSTGYTRNYTTIIDVKIVVTYTERAAQATESSYIVDLSNQSSDNAILRFNSIGNNFTYKTVWTLGDVTSSQEYDSSKANNTFSLAISKEWAAQFTSAFSKKGTVRLETYNESTRIGYFEYPVNYTIPSDYETEIELKLIDGIKHYQMIEGTDGEVIKESTFLQNESSKRFSFTYNNPYYSVISEPKIQFFSADGRPIRTLTASLKDNQDNQDGPDVSYEILEEQFFSDVGQIRIICSIKDSRKGTLTLIDNSSLSVTALPDFTSLPNIQRANANGDNYAAGTYLKIIGKLQNDKDGFQIIGTPTSTGTTIEEILRPRTEPQGTVEKQPDYYLTPGKFSADLAYDINFRIFSGTYYREKETTEEEDSLIEYDSNLKITLSSANYLLHFLNGGKAIGIGTAAQPPEGNEVGKITFGWPTQFFNPIEIDSGGTGVSSKDGLRELIGNLMYPIGSIYMSTSSESPSSLFGGTWEAWGSGRVPVGIDSSDSNFNSVEQTGGSANAILVSHNHKPASYNATGSEIKRYVFSTHLNVTDSVAQRRVDGGATTDPYALTAVNMGDLGQDSYTTTEGEDGTNKNLQPYITCYMWKRVK